MERLQKVLAAAGVASRRKSEEIIAAGRVAVNGCIIIAPGTKVSPGDTVTLDGKSLPRIAEKTYYLLNKPAGYITTVSDTHGRPTVMDLIPGSPRVFPVGRLDQDTWGLLLLTDDGALANALLHPSGEVKKCYRALVVGRISPESLARLAKGVELAEGVTSPARVQLLKAEAHQSLLEVTIHQGWKRQVRRMLVAVGHRALRLERVGFAFLTLTGLAPGEYRSLSAPEIEKLKRITGKR